MTVCYHDAFHAANLAAIMELIRLDGMATLLANDLLLQLQLLALKQARRTWRL